jgi:predicted pyridoxine 5'-phosphate oxidase superfamily flavin-nucleotide-binding protein
MIRAGEAAVFHEGERAVQRRAGVERDAARVGGIVGSWIPREYADFLSSQTFVVVAGRDARSRVWASALAGPAGFARALDDRRLLLAGELAAADPLAAAFKPPGGLIGILAIELRTRTRIRLNGIGVRTPEGIAVEVSDVFGNCRKYIQRREQRRGPAASWAGALPAGGERSVLSAEQARLIRGADTFFIASSHPQRGADASHRGGRPGFAELSFDGRTLCFPDYPGNRMFQTLGNIAIDPRAGLLFVEWETGSVLQLTGRARVVWDEEQVARWPGAERLVDVRIDAVREREGAMPGGWRLVEASRVNPPPRGGTAREGR